MKLLILFLSAVVFIACQTSQISSEKMSDKEIFERMIAEEKAADNKNIDEMVADEEEEKAEELAENEAAEEVDQCCAHWSAWGECLHEIIPGCSTDRIFGAPSANNVFELKQPNACCASWAADGQCLHEIIPGCSGN